MVFFIMSCHILCERACMMKCTQDMTTLEIMMSATSLCKYSRRAVYTDNFNIMFERVCIVNVSLKWAVLLFNVCEALFATTI